MNDAHTIHTLHTIVATCVCSWQCACATRSEADAAASRHELTMRRTPHRHRTTITLERTALRQGALTWRDPAGFHHH